MFELIRTDRGDAVVCACAMGPFEALGENAKYERACLPYRWRERGGSGDVGPSGVE